MGQQNFYKSAIPLKTNGARVLHRKLMEILVELFRMQSNQADVPLNVSLNTKKLVETIN